MYCGTLYSQGRYFQFIEVIVRAFRIPLGKADFINMAENQKCPTYFSGSLPYQNLKKSVQRFAC
jgi:hypothetical protein